MTESSRISIKTAAIIALLLFCIGAVFGFLFESTFTQLILQPELTKIEAVSTNVSQPFVSKTVFSFFVGLVFASIPISGIIASNFAQLNRSYLWILFFISVVIATTTAAISYYRNYFYELSISTDTSSLSRAFDEAGISNSDTTYIALDKIPYSTIPILSIGICLTLAFLILGLRTIRVRS